MRNLITRTDAKKIFQWCTKEYGRHRYKPYPQVSFRKPTYLDDGNVGYYDHDDNEIFLDSTYHLTIEELAKTLIEEYVHYIQNGTLYKKLADQYTYQNHPMEIEAKKIANKDYKRCVKYLKRMYIKYN
jgi:hypothetical protein